MLINVLELATAITPEMAADWLATSRGNRDESLSRIHEYARIMRIGAWRITHQGIAFDDDGHLIDGHHRLRAIIVSGCTVSMLVVGHVPNEMLCIDTGGPRRPIEQVSFGGDGIAQQMILMPEAKRMLSSVSSLLFSIAFPGGQAAYKHSNTKRNGYDVEQTAATYRDEILWTAERINGRTRHGRQLEVCGTYVLVAARDKDLGKLGDFVESISSGVGLFSQTDPRLKLRDYVGTPAIWKRDSTIVRASKVLSAWEAFAQDRALSKLQCARDPLAALQALAGREMVSRLRAGRGLGYRGER